MITCKVGSSKPLKDFVRKFLLYTYQDGEKYFPNYLTFAQDVYSDLQFNILTSEKRIICTIDKKLNTVKLPPDLRYLQQVSAIHKKELIPIITDNNVVLPYEEEVVAVPGCPNPKCNTDICSNVKSISEVTEVVTIGDIDYTNTIRTQIQKDGSIIKESCMWYTDGQEVADYELVEGVTINNQIDSIKINSVDIAISFITTEDPATVEGLLNALGLGIFTVVVGGGFMTITSVNNPNVINSVHVAAALGPAHTDPFTQTNEHINAIKECELEEICKVELTEDECIADTPANIAVVNKCCFPVTTCHHIPKPAPTMSQLGGVLYFSNTNYDKVLITYKTSGINFGDTLEVPDIAETAMISGIKYFSLKHKRVSESEIDHAKRTYNIDKNKLVDMLYPKRAQDIIKASQVTHIIY